jgi:hypothetical protein
MVWFTVVIIKCQTERWIGPTSWNRIFCNKFTKKKTLGVNFKNKHLFKNIVQFHEGINVLTRMLITNNELVK